jgi:enterochelin esterase family protein
MTRQDDGVWEHTAESVPAGVWEYNFVVDGLSVLDSLNPVLKPQRQPSRSIVHIPGSPANPWDFQDVSHGTVHQHGYSSKTLGRARELWVYTPPGYEREIAADPDRRYPLLVLQHGSGDNHQTWVVHGKAHWILDNLIAAHRARPMIVVMLDGHPLGRLARDTGPDRRQAALDAFRRELFEDALPLVESIYRVAAGADQRAIAGLSMGGGQALGVGLTHIQHFGWIGAFSAAPPSAEAVASALDDAQSASPKLKLLWMACGQDDSLRTRNEEFLATLQGKKLKYEWYLTPGDHSWPVWRQYLSDFAPRLFQDSGR